MKKRGLNIKHVQDIVAKVESYIGDVVDAERLEDPDYKDELREENWTLAIDAAHDMGLTGDVATDHAKAAMVELGYGDKPKERVEPVWPPRAGPSRPSESKATSKLDREIVQTEIKVGKLTQQLKRPDLSEQDKDAFTKERTQWRNHLEKLREKARNESASKIVDRLINEDESKWSDKNGNSFSLHGNRGTLYVAGVHDLTSARNKSQDIDVPDAENGTIIGGEKADGGFNLFILFQDESD